MRKLVLRGRRQWGAIILNEASTRAQSMSGPTYVNDCHTFVEENFHIRDLELYKKWLHSWTRRYSLYWMLPYVTVDAVNPAVAVMTYGAMRTAVDLKPGGTKPKGGSLQAIVDDAVICAAGYQLDKKGMSRAQLAAYLVSVLCASYLCL